MMKTEDIIKVMTEENTTMFSHAENELLTRTGPDTPMGDLMRRYWLPAVEFSELPDTDCPLLRFRLSDDRRRVP